jgi:phosphate transport system substrate-binding protein
MALVIAMSATFVTPAFAATTLHINGSTTLYPLAAKWASVYKAAHGWSITVAGGGSGKGISDVKSGAVDIGMSSRKKQASDGDSVVFTPVARDGLTIVVSRKLYNAYPSYINKMTPSQVQKIYRGQITNWKQVNSKLPNHSIDLIGRTGSSGTYTYFKQMFLTSGTASGIIGSTTYKQSPRTRTYASNGMVRSAVANDKYAIGYLSEAYVNSTVKALAIKMPTHYYDTNYVVHTTPSSIAGKYVTPTTTNCLNGTYKYVRPLYFVTKGTPSGKVATFMNWCKSSTGQKYATSQHFLKLK